MRILNHLVWIGILAVAALLAAAAGANGEESMDVQIERKTCLADDGVPIVYSVAGNRKVKADFDAAIMNHMGHYPMLERPKEFNDLVEEVIARLTK